MRFLLDTHAFLWWVTAEGKIPPRTAQIIGDAANEIHVSVATGWEIAIKKKLRRLEIPDDLSGFMTSQIARNGFRVLPITMDHALGTFLWPDPPNHRDPFDRMLAAQATVERLALISRDEQFDAYGVERVW